MIVCPSEGSMSDFVARTPDEWEFRQWMGNKCKGGYVEVEMVASGEGIANLYKWLREARPGLLTDVELDAEIMAASEPAGDGAWRRAAGPGR